MRTIAGLLLLCFFVLVLNIKTSAQSNNFGQVWVQGQFVIFTTTFNGTASPINQQANALNSLYFGLGSSGICDSAGNLALICNGYDLFNKQGQLIKHGDTIVAKALYEQQHGYSSLAQSSIILPFSNGKYRVITPNATDSMVELYWKHPGAGDIVFDQLLCHEVDMNVNGGKGEVTKRMMSLLENVKLSKTQMMACRHGDGKSWWLLKQASDTNLLYKFLLTDEKIYGPYIQGFAGHLTKWDICGQAMFSKDGSKYATTIQGFRKVFLADFDRCNGMLSNPTVIDVPTKLTQNPNDSTQGDSSTCGLAFSPNGRFLYVNGFFTVQQLDLQESNVQAAWTLLSGLDTTWQEFQQYSNMYPGPDGRIYVGNWGGLGGQMSVINSPDNKGTASNFCRKCLRFPGFVHMGITRFAAVASPPCMPNYDLGPANPPCYPVGVDYPEMVAEFKLYPNPSRGLIEVQHSKSGELNLFDMTGKLVASFKLDTRRSIVIDIKQLPSGVYQYKFIGKDTRTKAGKLVIAR